MCLPFSLSLEDWPCLLNTCTSTSPRWSRVRNRSSCLKMVGICYFCIFSWSVLVYVRWGKLWACLSFYPFDLFSVRHDKIRVCRYWDRVTLDRATGRVHDSLVCFKPNADTQPLQNRESHHFWSVLHASVNIKSLFLPGMPQTFKQYMAGQMGAGAYDYDDWVMPDADLMYDLDAGMVCLSYSFVGSC